MPVIPRESAGGGAAAAAFAKRGVQVLQLAKQNSQRRDLLLKRVKQIQFEKKAKQEVSAQAAAGRRREGLRRVRRTSESCGNPPLASEDIPFVAPI